MANEREVLKLRRENGRSITAFDSGTRIALIVWRKNGGAPLLPLVLDSDEAEQLADMLVKAVKKSRDVT